MSAMLGGELLAISELLQDGIDDSSLAISRANALWMKVTRQRRSGVKRSVLESRLSHQDTSGFKAGGQTRTRGRRWPPLNQTNRVGADLCPLCQGTAKQLLRNCWRDYRTGKQAKKVDPQAIWADDEVPERHYRDDLEDTRPQPRYDILYQQDVMAEDNFLGLAGKTPGSQDCTHVVVKVVFPGCQLADLDLDVTKNHILAQSPKLRLSTYLPVPVDETKGKAKWDAKKEVLSVTLPIAVNDWVS